MAQAAEKVRIAPRAVGKYLAQIAMVFAVQFAAGKLGEALPIINSGGIGPVWPASGIALSVLLLFGYQVWPGVAAGAFLLAFLSPIPHIAAAVYAAGTTLAALTAAFLLRRLVNFCASLSRLRDALGLIVFGAFGSGIISASIGVSVLYGVHVRGWSGFGSAWLIYWLGDSTGVLLVTPLVLTFPNLLRIRPRVRIAEFAVLLLLLTVACFIVFGDLPLIPVRLHVLAFAVLPFVMWAAIRFGVSGTVLSTLIIAIIATAETAFGRGPFAQNTPFTNAVLLDVFFVVLSMSGMTLAAAISEREQAEREREQLVRKQAAMEERLRLAAIVESSDDAIIGKDMDGIITDWNKGAERLYGYSAGEMIGLSISLLVPPDRSDDFAEIITKIKQGDTVNHYETVGQKKDGTRVEVSLTVSPIIDTEGRIVGASAIARDITERKLAEEALLEMSGRLITAHEEERTRIARELHDDLSQRMALLQIGLEQFEQDMPGLSSNARQQLHKVAEVATEVSSDIHDLSRQLHPSKLDTLGLAAAVGDFCRELSKRHDLQIEFLHHDVPRQIPKDVTLCLYRITQEALQNVVKHSGATEATVELTGHGDRIDLCISDSGAGFSPESTKGDTGLGLISMRERLRLVDGHLAVESEPSHGTRIRVRIPLGSTNAQVTIDGKAHQAGA
jgi:PAS domain S-box-containing protein